MAWFVEHDAFRFREQGTADAQLLLHPFGKLLPQLLFFIEQFKAGKERVRPLFPVGKGVGAGDELQMLGDGEQVVDGGHFRDVAQKTLGF